MSDPLKEAKDDPLEQYMDRVHSDLLEWARGRDYTEPPDPEYDPAWDDEIDQIEFNQPEDSILLD